MIYKSKLTKLLHPLFVGIFRLMEGHIAIDLSTPSLQTLCDLLLCRNNATTASLPGHPCIWKSSKVGTSSGISKAFSPSLLWTDEKPQPLASDSLQHFDLQRPVNE
jgi:hypothetical protein